MSSVKQLLAGVLACGAMTWAPVASAIVVGGVDFGTPGTNHFETTTLAETFVNGDGQALIGYGQVNTVNGNLLYAGTTNRLYFYFYNFVTDDFTPTSTGFTGGVIDVYLGPTINLLTQSSVANIATITGYTPWVRLNAEPSLFNVSDVYTLFANGTLTGSLLSFTGSGLLSVDTSGTFGIPAVAAFLDANNIATGVGSSVADISLTSSGNNQVLNPFDNTIGCNDGSAQPGQWCIAGTADLRGTTVQVPEPATLALLGVALAGLGVARRRIK